MNFSQKNKAKSLFLSFSRLFCVYFGIVTFVYAEEIETHFEADSPVPLVEIALVFPGGSSQDPIGQEGLTDFLGEMLFRGTVKRDKQDLDKALDDIAAQVSVETRLESTVIRAKVLANAFDTLGSLLLEVLTQPAFRENEIAKFKKERIANLQEEKSSDKAISSKLFAAFLFGNHPYGRSVDGKESTIKKIGRAQLFTHLSKIIRKNGLVVLGQGQLDQGVFQNWVKQLEALLPATQTEISLPSKPAFAEEKRLLLINKPDRTQTQVWMGQAGISMGDKRYVPLSIVNHVFGGPSFQSILMQEIRVKRGWSYGAGSAFRFANQPRSWHLYYFPATKDTAPAVTVGQHLFRKLIDEGITEEQFQFAQSALIKNSGFNCDTPAKRMENKILEITLGLPEGFVADYPTLVKGVDYPTANAVIKETFDAKKLQIAVLGTMTPQFKKEIIEASGVDVTKKQNVTLIPYDKD